MTRSRRVETVTEVAVGAFIFVVLGLLAVMTILLSTQALFRDTHEILAVFEDVRGLQEGDKVWMRGVNIGVVDAVAVEDRQVHVRLSLSTPVGLREDYTLRIEQTSLLGGQVLTLDPGSSDAETIPEDTVLEGETPVQFIQAAAQAAATVRVALDEGEGLLGALVSEENELYVDFRDTVANVKHISGDIREQRGTVGKLIGDDTLYLEASQVVHEVRAAVDDFRETTPVTTFTSILFGAF